MQPMHGAIPLLDGECYLHEGFLPPARADRCFNDIHRAAKWHQPRVRLFGKEVASPRLAAWYGDAGAVYAYSGQVNHPLPWFDALAKLRRQVECYTGARFNSVLLNLYRDGDDAMGWHADDEPGLGATIASLSLGAPRRFLLRHRDHGKRDSATLELILRHGSLLVMRGETQRHWRHCIPRTKRAVGARINLTFRRVIVADDSAA